MDFNTQRCRLLSHITMGKTKRYYTDKYKTLKERYFRSKRFVEKADQPLRMAFMLLGGLGDLVLHAHFIYLFSKKIDCANYVLDIYTPDGEKQLKSLFAGQNFISNLFYEKKISPSKRQYDLIIYCIALPIIMHVNKVRLYNSSKKLFDLISKYEIQNVLLNRNIKIRPLCDGQTIMFALNSKRKKWQMFDVNNELNLTEKYTYPLKINLDDKEYLHQLNLTHPFICFHRGVDERNTDKSVKQWPLSYYDILISKIKQKYPHFTLVQVGVSDARCPAFKGIDVNLVGKTDLEQLKEILKNAFIHIDGEGGMVHLRHALQGGPSIVLFGPTSRDFYGYSENINLVGNGCNHWCEWMRPDWQRGCWRGFQNPPCMYSITPEMVFESFEKLVEKNNA